MRAVEVIEDNAPSSGVQTVDSSGVVEPRPTLIPPPSDWPEAMTAVAVPPSEPPGVDLLDHLELDDADPVDPLTPRDVVDHHALRLVWQGKRGSFGSEAPTWKCRVV